MEWAWAAAVRRLRGRRAQAVKIDFASIRERNPLGEFCEARDMQLRRNGPDGQLVCLCPFHTERTPSFTIYPDGHAHCYGCGWRGDVIDLCAALDGLQLADAATKLSGDPLPDYRPVTPPAPAKPKERYQLTGDDIKRMAIAAHRLASDQAMITQLTAWRPEWTTEAIRAVALDGDLGFEDNCEHKGVNGPAILYGYTHGIKARWLATDRDGKRIFRWLCGGSQGECWRQSLLGNRHQTVYITEGETDTLSLLSFDIDQAGDSLVLALAGAQMMPEPKAFTDLDIIIVPDPDQAGEQACHKLTALLQPLARSIKTLQLEAT
jgi:hypothetical protein